MGSVGVRWGSTVRDAPKQPLPPAHRLRRRTHAARLPPSRPRRRNRAAAAGASRRVLPKKPPPLECSAVGVARFTRAAHSNRRACCCSVALPWWVGRGCGRRLRSGTGLPGETTEHPGFCFPNSGQVEELDCCTLHSTTFVTSLQRVVELAPPTSAGPRSLGSSCSLGSLSLLSRK